MAAPQPRQQNLNLGAAAPAAARKFPDLLQIWVYIALLLPRFVMAQFFAGGELSQRAPYGLPAQDFAAAIATPASTATFTIAGYNVSIPPAGRFGQASIDAIPGWSLTVSVTGNVPLAKASEAAPVDKSLYVAATGLSITPPANVPKHNTTGWRLCATVFTAGLSSFAVDHVRKDRAGMEKANNGTCSGILPDACIRRLQLTSVIGR
ncbi:hypothetical protein F5144DRAFT_211397 [Chaetomium tenue]|uniref:Uncharacterized protein n=1 Tax=Chaetomium tenue TaxID=1854479 RepID=A0ACB7PG86_9PEZI|nr:hypothetical protein F5144DRAFT_211397 [Chaetomium globosum]